MCPVKNIVENLEDQGSQSLAGPWPTSALVSGCSGYGCMIKRRTSNRWKYPSVSVHSAFEVKRGVSRSARLVLLVLGVLIAEASCFVKDMSQRRHEINEEGIEDRHDQLLRSIDLIIGFRATGINEISCFCSRGHGSTLIPSTPDRVNLKRRRRRTSRSS